MSDTEFTRVSVAPKHKAHPNFCLDFLISGHVKLTRISYPCKTHPNFWYSTDKKERIMHGWIRQICFAAAPIFSRDSDNDR